MKLLLEFVRLELLVGFKICFNLILKNCNINLYVYYYYIVHENKQYQLKLFKLYIYLLI